ncbi:MAG: UbiA family prenyltransferase [Archangium sp.]
MKWAFELLKVSRPGFWPTQLWFFVLPFGQRDMFSTPAFWLGCVYVTFPLGLLLYGWNDIFDAETDRANGRKDSWLFGACLDDAGLARLPRWIIATQLPFLVLFTWIGGVKMLAWFAAVAVTNALYNQPPLGFKNRPVLDVLAQLGYLLVFVLASWLCAVPQLSWPAMVFSALFAMQGHLFGQLMDVEQDRAAGRKTTAVVFGVRSSKFLAAAILLGQAVLSFFYFAHVGPTLFAAAGALFFLVDALVLSRERPYPSLFAKVFFVGWNVVVIATAYVVWKTGIFMLTVQG